MSSSSSSSSPLSSSSLSPHPHHQGPDPGDDQPPPTGRQQQGCPSHPYWGLPQGHNEKYYMSMYRKVSLWRYDDHDNDVYDDNADYPDKTQSQML